jgi:hypothetical protein
MTSHLHYDTVLAALPFTLPTWSLTCLTSTLDVDKAQGVSNIGTITAKILLSHVQANEGLLDGLFALGQQRHAHDRQRNNETITVQAVEEDYKRAFGLIPPPGLQRW